MKRSALLFDRPEIVEGTLVNITNMERLSEVLDCVAPSAHNPIYKAVTVSVKAGSTTLMAYSTSGMTMIHAAVGNVLLVSGEDRAWVIPKLAVQQMQQDRRVYYVERVRTYLRGQEGAASDAESEASAA